MMKGIIFVFFVFCGTLSHAEFCVQSYNAYGPAYSLNLKGRTNLLLDLLNENGFCEIMTFQEVWRESHIDHLLMGLNSLEPRFSFYHANNPFENVSTGLLTASLYPILRAESLIYSEYPNGVADWFRGQLGVKKALGTVRVQLVDGEIKQDTWIVNTHLHHSSQVIRIAQIVELGEYLNHNEIKALPLILAGDFNFKPDSLEADLLKVYSEVRDTHIDVHGDYRWDEATYDNNNPSSWGGESRVIDYILYRNSEGYKIAPIQSTIYPKDYNGKYMSDHYGRMVNFRLVETESYSVEQDRERSLRVFKDALRVLRSERANDFDVVIKILEDKIASYSL